MHLVGFIIRISFTYLLFLIPGNFVIGKRGGGGDQTGYERLVPYVYLLGTCDLITLCDVQIV